MNRFLFVLPLLTLAILAGFFGWSLLSGRDPASIGSVMARVHPGFERQLCGRWAMKTNPSACPWLWRG